MCVSCSNEVFETVVSSWTLLDGMFSIGLKIASLFKSMRLPYRLWLL